MRANIIKNAKPLITGEEWDRAQQQLKTTPRDPTVGISIVPVKIENGVGTYATVIDPGKAASVHFHPRGDEEYQIISGKDGVIKLLTLGEAAAGKAVPDSTPVGAGDYFVIPPNCMHQLVNTGSSTTEPLVLIFRSTADHLTEENRMLTPNWQPPAAAFPALQQ